MDRAQIFGLTQSKYRKSPFRLNQNFKAVVLRDRRVGSSGEMRASILRRLFQCILLVLLISGLLGGIDGLDCYVGRDGNYSPLDCSIGICRDVGCLCAKAVHIDGGVSRRDFHVEPDPKTKKC